MNSDLLRFWGIVLLTVLLSPANVSHAVGLGDIVVRSSLDAPFLAEINLVSVKAEELDTLRANLASDSDFRRARIERVDTLDNLIFRPSVRDDGSAIVQVTSRRPIAEPYLHFLVTLEWTGGRIIREYTVLLDPPTYDGTIPAKISAPRIPGDGKLSRTVEQEAELTKLESGQPYGPVKRGDYLFAIGEAIDIDSNISIYQRLYGILRDNPHAFIAGNMNLLRAGVVLDIPTAEELATVSRLLAMETFTRQFAEWQEYRKKFRNTSPATNESRSVAPGLALMKETIKRLEEEIDRLRGLLEVARTADDASETIQYRKQLSEDVIELEAARDRLIEAMDSAPGSDESTEESVPTRYVLKIVQPAGEGKVEIPSEQTIEPPHESVSIEDVVKVTPRAMVESDDLVMIRKNYSVIEETLLSRTLENEKLREQIRLLEEKVQKTVILLRVQDEALALAQQQAAVYSAALEASKLEVVSTKVRVDEAIQEQETSNSADEMLVEDDIKSTRGQILDQKPGIVEQAIAYIDDESNRPVLLAVGVILLLLLSLLVMFGKRRKITSQARDPKISGREELDDQGSRFESGPGENTTPSGQVERETSDTMEGRGVATKLDLARAYIEMGDHEAAIELLSEVQAQGTPEQQAQAEKLRESLQA